MQKHRVEDIADSCSGIKEVRISPRVQNARDQNSREISVNPAQQP